MYIYFDTNGTIKEVINDESIRRGSSDYNKIYCYLEGNPDIDDIWYLQKNPNGTLTNEVSFVDNIVTKAIPYDSHRDMKYFQDFEEYQFYVFTLSSSYLSQNGLVVATIRVAENNTLWALGELTFNVQQNVIKDDNDITQSQYDYLLLTISSYYSKTEIDNKLNLKADKTDTYTKTQVDNKLDLKADKAELAEVYSKEYNLINDLTRTDNYRYNSNTAGISAATGYYIYTSLQLTANTTYYFHNIMGYFSFIVGGNRFSESTANLLDGAYTSSQDEAILLCSATTSNVIFTDSYYIYLNLVANENKYLATENFINPNITLDVPNYMTLLTSGKYWSSNGIGVSEGTSASADTYARLRLPAGTYYLKNAYGYFCWYQTSNGYSRVSNTTETVGNYTFTMSVEGGSLYVTTSTGVVPFLYNDQDAYNKALSSGTHIKPSLLTAYRTAAEQDAIDDALGVTVVTVKTDGTGDYTSLTAAANSITDASASKRYEIHIYAGTYDILTELGGSDFLSGITSTANNRKGVQIKNYVSLIGIGDVFLEYLPSDSVSTIYTTTCVSPIEVYGNTTIENIHIKAKNCRYCVHDETGNSSTYANSKHVYKNCFFEHLGNYSGGWVSSAAIASGSSSGCRYAYIDCTFKSASFYAWSLHNNANQNGLIISFDGCVFDGLYGNFTGKISYYGINSTDNVSYIFMKNSTSTYPFGIFQENSGVTSTNIYELHNFSTIKFYNDSTYVPNELNDLRDDLTTAETTITTLQSDLTTVMQVNKNYTDNAINDLRWELGSHTLDVSSDTDVAFSKSVPANTIGCQINKIGGMSYKYNQLFDTTDYTLTRYNVTISRVASTHTITITTDGIASNNGDLPLGSIAYTPNHKYLLHYLGNNTGSNIIIQQIMNRTFVRNKNTSAGNNTIFNYTETDANKLNFVVGFANGGTPSASMQFMIFDLTAMGIETSDVSVATSELLKRGIDINEYQAYDSGSIRDSAVTSVVSKGFNAETLETLTIDSNIQALTGYGWGVNDTCYNYINFEIKKFVKKVGRVDLETISVSNIVKYDVTVGTLFRVFITDVKITDSAFVAPNAICIGYTTTTLENRANMTLSQSVGNSALDFINNSYSTVEAFKTAMSGVYLYYELAEPVETDISEYLDDNSIEVEPNGTLTFNNTYEQAVPSEIDYLIEEVKA